VAGLWLTPFLLNRVGQHDYGLWLVGAQLLAYLSLMDFGIVALLPRATAYATGRAGGVQDARDLREIIGQTAWVVLCQTPLVAIAAAVLWLTIPASWGSLRNPITVVLISFVLAFPLRIFAAVLQGLQDLAFLGKLNICAWLFGTAITVALVFAGKGLYSLAVGWTVTQFTSALISYLRLHRRFPHILPRCLPAISWLTTRAQLKQGFWISVAQIAQVLTTGTDILILGSIIGPLPVVPYACTSKLISVLANQPQMLMQSAFPGLSEMRTSESRKRLFDVCTTLSQATLLISGLVVCVGLSVNQGFVGWWVGQNQYGGVLLTILFATAMLLRHWNTTWIYPLLCFGRERRLSLTNLADGAVTTGFCLALIWLLGSKGGPLSAILGVCLVSVPANLAAVASELKVTRWALVLRFWPWCWRFLVVGVISGIAAKFWMPRSFITLAGTTVIVSAVYGLIMVPIIFKSGLGAYVAPRLSSVRMKLRVLNVGNTA